MKQRNLVVFAALFVVLMTGLSGIAAAGAGPGENLIANPGFESGKTSWVFYTNGNGQFTADYPAYSGTNSANISISRVGSNMQLYQSGISLEPKTRYRLSFVTYSSTGHDMTVMLINHITPYNPYMPGFKVNLISDKWNMFSTEFTTPDFSGIVNNARLMFYLSGYAKSGDKYRIDDVRLEKVLPVSEVKVLLSSGSPAGLSKPGLKQLVASFDFKNTGGSEIVLQKIFLTRNGTIGERLAVTDRLEVYDGTTLVGAGSNWACTEPWCVSDVAIAKLVIPSGTTRRLDVRVDTDAAQAGDTLQVSITEIDWNDSSGEHYQQIGPIRGGLLEY